MSARLRRLDPAVVALAVASVASAVLLVYMVSKLSFLLDEWDLLLHRRGFSPDALLDPHAEHLTLAPILIWKAIQASVGMESTIAYEVASLVAFVAAAALLFVYLRRRVGAALALAGAIVVLFLGSAWEDLLSIFQIGYFGSTAAGLGALLALEREDRRGDLAACGLFLVSLSFSSVALPFLAAGAVRVWVGPERRARAWVVGVPIAVYAVWWLGWGHEAPSSLSFDNLATAPAYVLDGLASSVASLLGLATSRNDLALGALEWGRPLLALVALLAVIRLRAVGRIGDGLLVALAFALVFWFLAAVNASQYRPPDAPRYQYVGVIAILLIAAELLRGVRPTRTALAIVFGVVAISVAANLAAMRDAWQDLKGYSAVVRGALSGLELARDRVPAEFTLTGENSGFDFFGLVDAGSYFSAIDDYGSPAYAADEIATAPEPARGAADKVLADAYGLGFAPRPGAAAERCLEAEANRGEPRILELPRGGLVLELEAEGSQARLRRYAADSWPVELGSPPPGASALAVPADASAEPWELELTTSGAVRACRL